MEGEITGKHFLAPSTFGENTNFVKLKPHGFPIAELDDQTETGNFDTHNYRASLISLAFLFFSLYDQ